MAAVTSKPHSELGNRIREELEYLMCAAERPGTISRHDAEDAEERLLDALRNLEEQFETLRTAAEEVASRAQQMPVQLSDERGALMGYSTFSAVESSVMENLIAVLNGSNPASSHYCIGPDCPECVV